MLCVAEAGETPGATASPQQQQGGKFRRTFSFRRRERQESVSVSSPGPCTKEQTPTKVILCSNNDNNPCIHTHAVMHI